MYVCPCVYVCMYVCVCILYTHIRGNNIKIGIREIVRDDAN